MTGPPSTNWYLQTFGTLITGLLLTFGPQLQNLIGDRLYNLLRTVLGLTPVPVVPVVPVPVPQPVDPTNPFAIVDKVSKLIKRDNPETLLLSLLTLAGQAKQTRNTAVLQSLETAAHELVTQYFTDGVPHVTPPPPTPVVPVQPVVAVV